MTGSEAVDLHWWVLAESAFSIESFFKAAIGLLMSGKITFGVWAAIEEFSERRGEDRAGRVNEK